MLVGGPCRPTRTPFKVPFKSVADTHIIKNHDTTQVDGCGCCGGDEQRVAGDNGIAVDAQRCHDGHPVQDDPQDSDDGHGYQEEDDGEAEHGGGEAHAPERHVRLHLVRHDVHVRSLHVRQAGQVLRPRVLLLDVETSQIPPMRDFRRVTFPHLEKTGRCEHEKLIQDRHGKGGMDVPHRGVDLIGFLD